MKEVNNIYDLEIKFITGYRGFQMPRQLTISSSYVEPLKYEYRIGLETLIVRTLNWWAFHVKHVRLVCQLTRKCLAWGVRLQRQNLKRLAGVCMNGGACGLIR